MAYFMPGYDGMGRLENVKKMTSCGICIILLYFCIKKYYPIDIYIYILVGTLGEPSAQRRLSLRSCVDACRDSAGSLSRLEK